MRLLCLLPLLAAAAPVGFTPGLWQVTSAPGIAALNGRPLRDLPYSGPATPPTICLSAADARDPAWLVRDLGPGCTVMRGSLARGRIVVTATCPPQAPGLARGDIMLTGSWTRTRYDVRFSTSNPSENGDMSFTGTMTGRRVGACPA